MLELKIIRATEEEIKNAMGLKVLVETLVCEIKFGSSLKILHFNWNDRMSLYKTKEPVVYVRLPQYATKRATVQVEYNIYENKVRRAHLYIQKSASEHILLEKYKVLDGEAHIVSWMDSEFGMTLKQQEAHDSHFPFPIFIKQ